MEWSEDRHEIMRKRLEIQKTVGGVLKNAKNPHFKSKYAELPQVLDHLLPELNRLNLVLTQSSICTEDGQIGIETEVYCLDSKQWFKDQLFYFPEKKNCQGVGANRTYFRRYALVALFNLREFDDDGNKACNIPEQRQRQAPAHTLIQPNDVIDVNNPSHINFLKNYCEARQISDEGKKRIFEFVKSSRVSKQQLIEQIERMLG